MPKQCSKILVQRRVAPKRGGTVAKQNISVVDFHQRRRLFADILSLVSDSVALPVAK